MSNFDMYQNTGYSNNRNRKRTLILDIDDSGIGATHLGAGGEFNIELFEPLIIDKHSEVYLDNCLTFNSNIAQTPTSSAFALKINEFNMNSNVASSSHNNNMFNSLIIPNDHRLVSGNQGAVVHKGKKFNYVCDINPQTIHSLSGKITDLSGAPIFHGADTATQFTYALTGIDSGKLDIKVLSGAAFTGITSNAGANAVTGTFLATHFTSATTLHFATDKLLAHEADFVKETGNIIFTQGDGMTADLVLTNGGGDNPDLTLIQNPARFIAEFSIISVQ
jgi:hypothetical protein